MRRLGVLLVFLAIAAPAAAAPGDLDPTFHPEFVARYNLVFEQWASTDGAIRTQYGSIAVDGSGRLLTSGSIDYGNDNPHDYAQIARFKVDGTADETFGPRQGSIESGVLPERDILGASSVRDLGLSLDAAGRLRGSYLLYSNGNAAVAAYSAAGVLNPEYGENGYALVTRSSPMQTPVTTATGSDGSVYVVINDPRYRTGSTDGITAQKVDPDGRLVPSYYGNPVRLVPKDSDYGTHVFAAVVDAQDRLVVATTSAAGGGSGPRKVVAVRFNADGSPDYGFGDGGDYDSTPGPDGQAWWPAKAGANPDGVDHVLRDMTIGPDGSIYLAASRQGSALPGAVAKLTPDGDVDPSFGGPTGAVDRTAPGSVPAAIILQRGSGGAGKVILVGDGGGDDVKITRFTTAGVLDTTMDGDGAAVRDFLPNQTTRVGSAAATANGKLVVAGSTISGSSGQFERGYVTRFLLTDPDRVPDLRRPPAMSGTPKPDSVLTCAPGEYTNSPRITTFWDRAPRNTASDEDPAWTHVATGSTYTVTAADLGSRLRCSEEAINDDGSTIGVSGSKRVDADVPANLRKPTTTGTPVIPELLTCDTGEWSNGPDTTQQWVRDGVNIVGATNRTYRLTDDDRRRRVSCVVSARNDVGAAAATEQSNGLLVVKEVPALQRRPVTISRTTGGRATDIELECSDPGTWDEDYGSYEYRWLREDAEIAGATGKTYAATTDDLGRNVACVVFSTNPKGRSEAGVGSSVLVPLPATGTPGAIYEAGGFNSLDPTNLMAVSSEYKAAIRRLVTGRRQATAEALRTSCATGQFASEPLPDWTKYVYPGKAKGTYFGNNKQLCPILLKDFAAVVITADGAYWAHDRSTCRLPNVDPPGKTPCSTLGLPVPPLRSTSLLSELTPDERVALQDARPVQTLWDFDSDGRTDASCAPDAPILRSLYNRGIFKVRAVIVSAASAETGQYSVTDYDLDFFPQSASQKGGLRDGQPFACKTSLEPPPEPNLPCVNEVTFGRAHVTGNLCPISARRMPQAEYDGLPPDVQKMLLDQALSGPLRRGTQLRVTYGETRQGGLPDVPGSVAAQTTSQISALSTLDSAKAAEIPKGWADKLKQVKSFDLDKAQHAMDQIYIARGESFLNGVKMEVRNQASTVFVPSDAGAAIDGVKKLTVSSTNVATSLSGIPIGDPGKLSTDIQDRVRKEGIKQAETVLKGANLDALANSLKNKLNLGPFKLAGDAKVKLNPDGTATIDAWAELPQLLTKPGSKPIRTAVQVNATREGQLRLNGVHLEAPSAFLGGINIEDLALDYDGNGLSVKGKLLFPPVNQGIALNKFRLDNQGRFQELDVDYLAGSGQGIPLGYGLFMTKIGGGLSMNPDELRARTAISVGPSAGGGCPTVGIDAGFIVHFSPPPFFLDATGTVGLLCIPLSTTKFYANSTGLVDLSTRVGIDLGPLYYRSTLSGRLQLPRWQIAMKGEGGIRHIISAQIKALIGSAGLAGCGGIEVFPETPFTDAVRLEAGAGVRINGPIYDLPRLIGGVSVFTGCNLSKYSPFGKDVRQAGGGGKTFTIEKDAPEIIALELFGTGGSPRVTLRGPDGKVYDASTLGEDFAQHDGVSGLLDVEKDRTVLFVRGQAGNWTVTPVPGSPALADIRRADVLPEPKVTATVGGAGASRILRYRIAKIPGQVVTFVEQSPKGMRTIKTVKGGGTGRVAFTTSEGGGTARTVTAQLTQDGLPRDNVVVAKFNAPSPRAGKAPRLRIRRRGAKAKVSWGKAPYTKAYVVEITRGKGGRSTVRRTAKQRSLTFGGLSKGEGATVTVTSVAPSGNFGGARTASLRGDKTFSSFKNKKRPKVKRKKKRKKR